MDDEQRKFIEDSLAPMPYVNYLGEKKEINVKELLSMDKRNLPIDSMPATYLFIAQEADKRKLAMENLKVQLDAMQGVLRNRYADDAKLKAQNGGKKPPESMLTAAINATKSYVDLTVKYNKARYACRVAEHILVACQQKASLMQTLSAENREERRVAPHGNSMYKDF